jgi:hypothetical protein
MKSGGQTASRGVDQIGDGGIVGTVLPPDGPGEDPWMPVAGDTLLSGLQLEDAAVGLVEMGQGWLLG